MSVLVAYELAAWMTTGPCSAKGGCWCVKPSPSFVMHLTAWMHHLHLQQHGTLASTLRQQLCNSDCSGLAHQEASVTALKSLDKGGAHHDASIDSETLAQGGAHTSLVSILHLICVLVQILGCQMSTTLWFVVTSICTAPVMYVCSPSEVLFYITMLTKQVIQTGCMIGTTLTGPFSVCSGSSQFISSIVRFREQLKCTEPFSQCNGQKGTFWGISLFDSFYL